MQTFLESSGSGDLGESIKYDLEHDEYTSPEDAQKNAEYIVANIERASGDKAIEVAGEISETDMDLSISMASGETINIVHKYHPFGPGYTFVELANAKDEKSHGQEWSGGIKGENTEYDDAEDMISDMVRDLYIENGLLDPYTHQIVLPKEVFGNDPYFKYNSDEDDNQFVYFESEKAAQDWIDSLKIIKK